MELALDKLKAKFGDQILETSNYLGNETALVSTPKISEIIEFDEF